MINAEQELLNQCSISFVKFINFSFMLRFLLKEGVKYLFDKKINNHFFKNEQVQLVDSHGNELVGQFREIETLYVEIDNGTILSELQLFDLVDKE